MLAENIAVGHCERWIVFDRWRTISGDGERSLAASFAIRRAFLPDARALSVFAARLFRETYSDDTAAADLDAYIDNSFTKASQEAEIADPSAAIFLATAGDLIAGYAHVVTGATEKSPAFLNRIYVDAEWRGAGIATGLL